MGFIVEDKDGVRRGDASLTTGHEVNSLAIVNYHHQMIERGAESIERIPREYRDISALTMCVRPEQVAELKRRVHAFRETLMALTDPIEDPTTVYQLNIQLFPLNRIDELKNTLRNKEHDAYLQLTTLVYDAGYSVCLDGCWKPDFHRD